MARAEPVGARVQDDVDVVDLAGYQRLWRVVHTVAEARSSEPRVTSADVPSGNTSQSLTDSDAAGAVALTSNAQPRVPDQGVVRRLEIPDSESASSCRWSVDSPHGRWPAQSIQAAVPTSGRTSRDRPRPARRAGGRARRAGDGHTSRTQ